MKALATTALAASLLLSSCSSKALPEPEKKRSPNTAAATHSMEVDAAVARDLGLEIVRAEESPLRTGVTATGQLQMNEHASWHVGAITDGKIISVPVGVGDFVREGQVLAALHSHDVHDARATYRQAIAQLAREKVLAEQARTVRDRTRRLFDLRAASKEQLEAAEALYQSSNNTVAAAQADVDKAKFHLTDFLEVPAEADDEHGGDAARDGLTIKAPAAGTVMERKATVGTVVSAGDPVFTIADLRSLWLIAAVNEADMSRIRSGQRVQIEVRAFANRKFSGRVLQLGERLDPQTRTLQVRVLVPNREGLMKPDMFATADFETEERRAVIQVPEGAVQDVNGKSIVFVREESGSFRARNITVGSKAGGRVEITVGLRAGEYVVASGAFLLKTRLMKESGK